MADLIDKEQMGIVGSIFGASPEAQAIARERAAYTQGTQAGTNLLGGILGNVGMFSERAGAGLRSMLGQQTQEERIAALRQQVSQQFDVASPQGMLEAAQYLNQQGDSAGAQQLIMLAQQRAMNAQTIATGRAQELKALREPRDTMLQQIITSGKYTPESIAKFKESGNPADLVPGAGAGEKLGESTIKEIATAEKTNRVLTNTNKVLDKYIDDIDAGKLNLGWGALGAAGVQSLGVGKVSENTQQIKSLKKFVEQERNNILMAAKGTQTEGDAERALNQILSTTDWTSNTSMSNALKGLREYKNSQIDSNNVYIDNLRGTSRRVGASSAVAGAPAGKPAAKPVVSNAGYYDAVRKNPAWADATDKDIDDAIAAGTIKVGVKRK